MDAPALDGPFSLLWVAGPYREWMPQLTVAPSPLTMGGGSYRVRMPQLMIAPSPFTMDGGTPQKEDAPTLGGPIYSSLHYGFQDMPQLTVAQTPFTMGGVPYREKVPH